MSEFTVGQRIKALRKEYGLTLEQVGDAVGVGKSTVRKWETGMIANMRRDKIAALAQVLHTTPTYLMGWKEEIQVDNLFRVETKKFPLFGEADLTGPIWYDGPFETYVEAGSAPKADFCLKVKGDSMAGAGIYDGDIVFLRRIGVGLMDGDIVAVLMEDHEVILKRSLYHDKTGELILFSEDQRGKSMQRFSADERARIRILGKAVAVQRNLG